MRINQTRDISMHMVGDCTNAMELFETVLLLTIMREQAHQCISALVTLLITLFGMMLRTIIIRTRHPNTVVSEAGPDRGLAI